MRQTRWLAACAALALVMVSTGCARLGVIFPNSGANADATVTFTVTDADSGEELASGELSAESQSTGYLFGGKRSDSLNLLVEATYDDGAGATQTLSSDLIELGACEVLYVIIDNTEGEPTLVVSEENDTGILTTNWELPGR